MTDPTRVRGVRKTHVLWTGFLLLHVILISMIPSAPGSLNRWIGLVSGLITFWACSTRLDLINSLGREDNVK